MASRCNGFGVSDSLALDDRRQMRWLDVYIAGSGHRI